jgi:hypothetical protein
MSTKPIVTEILVIFIPLELAPVRLRSNPTPELTGRAVNTGIHVSRRFARSGPTTG